MNSLGVSPRVNYLYSDLSNGLILFQVLLSSILNNYSNSCCSSFCNLAFLTIIPTLVAADELHQAGHVRHEEGGGQGQARLFGSTEAALRGGDLLDGGIDLIFENIFYRC